MAAAHRLARRANALVLLWRLDIEIRNHQMPSTAAKRTANLLPMPLAATVIRAT
jgi:hypothetical protein